MEIERDGEWRVRERDGREQWHRSTRTKGGDLLTETCLSRGEGKDGRDQTQVGVASCWRLVIEGVSRECRVRGAPP